MQQRIDRSGSRFASPSSMASAAHPTEASHDTPYNAMPESSVYLEVTMLSGKVVLPEMHFSESALVSSVKDEVRAASGIPVWHQMLVWQMAALEHNASLGDLSLPSKGAALQLAVVLPSDAEVAQARHSIQDASAALNSLSLRGLTELKRLARPPAGVDLVLEAVLHLLAGIDPSIQLNSSGGLKDTSWKASTAMMKEPRRFLFALMNFNTLVDNGGIPERNIKSASRLCESMGPDFSPECIARKSVAASSLCRWVLSIIQYYDIVTQIRADFKGFDIMAAISEQVQ